MKRLAQNMPLAAKRMQTRLGKPAGNVYAASENVTANATERNSLILVRYLAA
jgi:hypothetical protein